MTEEIQKCLIPYHHNLTHLQQEHHHSCVFRKQLPVEGINFQFGQDGVLSASFTPQIENQGFDGILHGGLTAALIDCCLFRCLMGNNIVALTAELQIRYRKPIQIGIQTELIAKIHSIRLERVYQMQCEIWQKDNLCVKAGARFYKAI